MTEITLALGLVVLMIGCTIAGIAMGFRRARARSSAEENPADDKPKEG